MHFSKTKLKIILYIDKLNLHYYHHIMVMVDKNKQQNINSVTWPTLPHSFQYAAPCTCTVQLRHSRRLSHPSTKVGAFISSLLLHFLIHSPLSVASGNNFFISYLFEAIGNLYSVIVLSASQSLSLINLLCSHVAANRSLFILFWNLISVLWDQNSSALQLKSIENSTTDKEWLILEGKSEKSLIVENVRKFLI